MSNYPKPQNADAIKRAAIVAYEETFVTKQPHGLRKLIKQLSRAESKHLFFQQRDDFVECLKKTISPFNEETVGLLVDIVFNSSSVSSFKQLKLKPSGQRVIRPEHELRDFLLSKVASQDVLCIRHVPELSEVKREELWVFVRELFASPMHAAIARANLNLYLVQEGLEEMTEDYTTSDSYTHDDGYSDYLLYIITPKHVQFVHQPQNGMSSYLAFKLSFDDFHLLIMELYRSQNPNYSLSREVKYLSTKF